MRLDGGMLVQSAGCAVGLGKVGTAPTPTFWLMDDGRKGSKGTEVLVVGYTGDFWESMDGEGEGR
jgi:hypothetical protein